MNGAFWLKGMLDNLGRVLLLVAIVGVPIGAAFAAFGLKRTPVNIAIGVVFLVVVALSEGAYQTWRQEREDHLFIREAHEALTEERIGGSHFAELKAIVNGVRSSVLAREACHFANPKDRESLVAHFPYLDQPMSDWDKAILGLQRYSSGIEPRCQREAKEAGLVPPGFQGGPLWDWAVATTKERADRRLLGAPFWMNAWRFFGEEGQPPESMFFGRLGTAVAYPQADGALGFWDYILRFELIVADMQAWPETLDYARRDELSGWKELLGPLESQLEDLARREHYKRGDGCPQCR